MAAFELINFAKTLLAPSSPAEVLACAGRAAVDLHGSAPAFAAHVAPGRGWNQALLVRVNGVLDAPSPAERSALFAVYRRLAQRRTSLQLERAAESEAIFSALSHRGTRRLESVPLKSRDGRCTGMLVIAPPDDVKEADAAARRSQLDVIAALAGSALESSWRLAAARRDQERLLLFSETADEALWDWNLGFGELWWGGGLESFFGAGQQPAKHARWRDGWLEPAEARKVNATFEAARLGAGSSWSMEYTLRRADGTQLEVLERVYFLREADGRAYRVIGTLRDISALKAAFDAEKSARTEAEQASAVKDAFLAMLGHELRNPLAPILSSLELLERRTVGPDAQLAVLRRQATHLVRLVDDLMDVSRISRGKIELLLRPVPLDTLVLRAVELAQPLIIQRKHHLELDLGDQLQLFADEGRVTQVLGNLLGNAAKYTQPGGTLRLSARAEGPFAVIRVRDNGIGIAEEMLSQVFDMFVQGPQAIDRAAGGLGLGLTIARNIVKLHGGTLEAHSDGLGEGSELVVRLPLAIQQPTAAPEEVVATRRAMVAQQFLIIDDNEDAAVMLGEVLSTRGHSVQIVHHPVAALASFSRARPEVAIVDIGLPAMDGYELARRLRALPGGETTWLIAVTGYGQQSDRDKSMRAGFDGHLVKPISPESLEALIAKLTTAAKAAQRVTGT